MVEGTNGLREWRELLLKNIERLESKVDRLDEKVEDLDKFKSKVIGYAIGSGVLSGGGIAGLLQLLG